MESNSLKSANEQRRQDRRVHQVEFDRRCFDRRDKAFVYEKQVYLSDTNAVGNTYFAKYFEWQGIVRESFFFKCLFPDPAAFAKSGIKLITAEAHMKYKHETVLLDKVVIKLTMGKVRRASAELLFTFRDKNTNKLIGEGSQVVVFADNTGKPIPMPDVVIKNLKPFINK